MHGFVVVDYNFQSMVLYSSVAHSAVSVRVCSCCPCWNRITNAWLLIYSGTRAEQCSRLWFQRKLPSPSRYTSRSCKTTNCLLATTYVPNTYCEFAYSSFSIELTGVVIGSKSTNVAYITSATFICLYLCRHCTPLPHSWLWWLCTMFKKLLFKQLWMKLCIYLCSRYDLGDCYL